MHAPQPALLSRPVDDLTNHRVLLAQRPEGLVREEDFSHDTQPVPEPGALAAGFGALAAAAGVRRHGRRKQQLAPIPLPTGLQGHRLPAR